MKIPIYLKTYFSPFKPLQLKWYFGDISQGVPWFLPRKCRKNKEIAHHKFSLFLLETEFGGFVSCLYQECFQYIEAFSSLDEAQDAQKEYKQKSIILTSY